MCCRIAWHRNKNEKRLHLQPSGVLSFSTTFYNPIPKLRVTSLPLSVFLVNCISGRNMQLNLHVCSYGVTTTYMCWWRVCCISHVTSCHGWNTRPIKACSIALKSNVTSSTARTSSTRWPWLDVVIRRYLSFLLKKISIIINVMFNLCYNHSIMIHQPRYGLPSRASGMMLVAWIGAQLENQLVAFNLASCVTNCMASGIS